MREGLAARAGCVRSRAGHAAVMPQSLDSGPVRGCAHLTPRCPGLIPCRIGQLVFTFPEDATTSTGAPFWSAPKRFPSVLRFDAADPTHASFVQVRVQPHASSTAGLAGARCAVRCSRTHAPVLVRRLVHKPARDSTPQPPCPPRPATPGGGHPEGGGVRRGAPRVGCRRQGVRSSGGQGGRAHVCAPEGRQDRDRPQGARLQGGRRTLTAHAQAAVAGGCGACELRTLLLCAGTPANAAPLRLRLPLPA